MSTTTAVPIGSDQKYCSECAKVILRRAEICPGCGCRQVATQPVQPGPGFYPSYQTPTPPSPFTNKMIVLVLLNFLWSGAGNVAIGDRRGWGFVFANIIILVISFFTAFIPSILFFGFCCWTGYQYLTEAEASTSLV